MNWDLPSEFTPDFMSDLVWSPGPMAGFEVSEYGIIRRPLAVLNPGRSMRPGFLYPPEVRGRTWIRYRLIDPKQCKPVYLKIEEVMIPVFGKVRNKNLLNGIYVTRMKALVLEYNLRFIEIPRSETDIQEAGMKPLRKCTTCGKPTRDYRCSACWVKIRAASTSCDEPASEYRIVR